MDADACRKPAASHSLPPPPALFRARSGRVADLASGGGAAFSGPPDTPPRRSLVTVPFIWEDAPGKPKASSPPPPTADAETPAVAAANAGPGPVPEGGEHHRDSAHVGPMPLKLPPRLQQVASSSAAADQYTPSPSPKTVFQGPYYHGCAGVGGGGGGGRSKPPKWVRSGGAALRRTPSAGMALLSRTWSKRKAPAASASGKNRAGADHERERDAPWCSPASSDSSSSVSTRFRPADWREAYSEEEDDGSPRTSVRFTRYTRNRSLPSMTTTSNLWASVRRSVKHITPILHGARSWATTRYGH